ncbi:MAG TPA: SMP-30/gluconolactonase/LRE family protein [Gemmatimonadaceae bacterium]|nr:SMP-30/gluconolactonase/LRE family protein [Gemmatimonadaceae bacterium]
MRRFNVLVVAMAVVVAACSKQESASADNTKTPATGAAAAAAGVPVAAKLGETPDMKTPESVRYDPELDVFYVSNINGNPSQHDGNGFIAVVRADSTGVTKMLVEGGKNGAKLDAPKGLALVGDTLWVADINHLRAFNRRTGAPIADVNLSSLKASFLNDVVVGGDGAIYTTDTGLFFDAKGAMTHPGLDQLIKVTGRKAEVIKVDSLNGPNGIAWDATNARFLLAPFNSTSVQTWKAGDKTPATLVTGPGTYDGIEVLSDGRVLVTSWADSAVHVIQNGAMSKLVSNVTAPADIGVDTKRGVLAIPRFNDGKIDYYKIP